MTEIRLPCPTCNGHEFVSFEDRHVENLKEGCPTCKGVGTIPANTGQTPEASAPADPSERRHTRAVS